MKKDKELEKQIIAVAQKNSGSNPLDEFLYATRNRRTGDNYYGRFGPWETFMEWIESERETWTEREEMIKETYRELSDTYGSRDNPESVKFRLQELIEIVKEHLEDPEENPITSVNLKALEVIEVQVSEVCDKLYEQIEEL